MNLMSIDEHFQFALTFAIVVLCLSVRREAAQQLRRAAAPQIRGFTGRQRADKSLKRWTVCILILLMGTHRVCADEFEVRAGARSLKVFSNNVGLFPQRVAGLLPTKVKEKKKSIIKDESERAEQLARSLIEFEGDPDVLLLQEIWSLKAKDVLVRDLAVKYPYFKHPETDPTSLLAMLPAGLILFSKYPLDDFAFQEFTQGFGADKIARKGIIGASLKIADKKIWVFTTHLQAGAKRDKSVKPDQLNECNQFIRKLAGAESDVRAVLTGDFNIDSTKPDEYHEIFSRLIGARDSYKERSGFPKGTTRNPRFPNKRIDYLLTFGVADGSSTIVDPAGNRISDHLAVFGTIPLD